MIDRGHAAPAASIDRLREIWRRIESGASNEHTSVVLPSLTFDREELAKIRGIQFYEERLLFSLFRLQDPRARLVYLTSEPVHPEILVYYLTLIEDVSPRDAERRLSMLCAYDSSQRSLTEKILERPRLIERIRRAIGDGQGAYLTCFNTTVLEQRLAAELDIPINGADPQLAWIGTKTGSRRVFDEAGVAMAFGVTGVHTRADVVRALDKIAGAESGVRRAVVKLDDSFAGAGNALFRFPQPLPDEREARLSALDTALCDLQPTADESPEAYLQKLERMGGVVEQFIVGVDGDTCRSPSVQLRIDPEGQVRVLSTHEQVLEGPTGQTYVGCRFPADEGHRAAIQEQAMKVGRVVAAHGVVGRFGIDFLSGGSGSGATPATHGVEINLRMGGTTFPFLALQSLVRGALDAATGEYVSSRGIPKCYFATDNLRSSSYVGLSPEDFLEIVRRRQLLFDSRAQKGPVFHMIGALSELGRLGVTCIADRADEAEAMYRSVVHELDEECHAVGGRWAPPTHPVGLPISSME